MDLDSVLGGLADRFLGRLPVGGATAGPGGLAPERGPGQQRSRRLAWRLRLGRAGPRQAARVARFAASRVFAVEHCGRPLSALAATARRELAGEHAGWLARIDTLALAAAAAQQQLGLRPHLAQMTAAALMLDDCVAELPSGEGKSLALALAAVVRALSGMPVDVIVADPTRADDAVAAHRPLFDALGLRVASVHAGLTQVERAQRRRADICYGTADALMADHLVETATDAPARGLNCALVDDADRLLIDRANLRVGLLAAPHATPAAAARTEAAASTAAASPTAATGVGPAKAVPHGPSGRTLTVRGFLRRYWRLAGVSSTACEARGELLRAYGVDAVAVKSIYPAFRRELGWRIVADAPAQHAALLARVGQLRAGRRATLVVAADRAALDDWRDRLAAAGFAPVVLGGRGPQAAELALAAGRAGAVSLRDASLALDRDVVPDPYARAAGGVAVVSTCLGASRRDDRRRQGWAGRQGQPGTVEAILDAGCPLRVEGRPIRAAWLAWLAALGCPQWLLAWCLRRLQRRIERRAARRRVRIERAVECGRPALAPTPRFVPR